MYLIIYARILKKITKRHRNIRFRYINKLFTFDELTNLPTLIYDNKKKNICYTMSGPLYSIIKSNNDDDDNKSFMIDYIDLLQNNLPNELIYILMLYIFS